MARKKAYEEWFEDMTDEQKKSRKEMYTKTGSQEKQILVELFKIDGNKRQMILLKEPYMRDVIIDLSEEKILEIMRNYSFFKIDVKDGIAVFAQDITNKSMMNHKLRMDFKRDFGKYY